MHGPRAWTLIWGLTEGEEKVGLGTDGGGEKQQEQL